jgi:hypothetical protein
MNRRDFLKLLGQGAAVSAAGLILPASVVDAAELEPRRRWWQVPRSAPFGRKTYSSVKILITGQLYPADNGVYQVSNLADFDAALGVGHQFRDLVEAQLRRSMQSHTVDIALGELEASIRGMEGVAHVEVARSPSDIEALGRDKILRARVTCELPSAAFSIARGPGFGFGTEGA